MKKMEKSLLSFVFASGAAVFYATTPSEPLSVERALDHEHYTEIKLLERDWDACVIGTSGRKFRAKNTEGKPLTGTVCADHFGDGATILIQLN